MKLIVALALAAAAAPVLGSEEAPCFLDFEGDCAQLSGVCQTFSTLNCEGRNTAPGDFTKADCDAEGEKFPDVEVNWCSYKPPEDFEDCSQFSKTCKVFDKNEGKLKYEADYTEADCSVTAIDVGQTGGVDVQWCREQSLEKKCNSCAKGGKKCIVRKGSNGKILTRNQNSPACKDPKADDVVFNCPNYELLLNCAMSGGKGCEDFPGVIQD